jgi:hypothetical protein
MRIWNLGAVAALAWVVGCGGGGQQYGSTIASSEAVYSDDESVMRSVSQRLEFDGIEVRSQRSDLARMASSPPPDAPSPMPSATGESFESEAISAGADSASSNEGSPRQRYADATPPPAQPVAGTARAGADSSSRVTDDAHHGPLLIYTATVHLSVFEVERTQQSVIEIIREAGGFLQLQNDQQLTVRVPAANFRDALARIEQVGDVLHRNVQALDVSDEYRDLTIRLQNALAMRDRLQLLLQQASTTEQALQVEHELERVTLIVEQLRGRMQLLGDRLAFSTITVMFQPHAEPTDQPGTFRLPVPWLDELTLTHLLSLPYED